MRLPLHHGHDRPVDEATGLSGRQWAAPRLKGRPLDAPESRQKEGRMALH
jgi:hypothetical protein